MRHTLPGGTTWRRSGPWWRVVPDVAAHGLRRRRLLPRWAVRLACRWRGGHRYRIEF